MPFEQNPHLDKQGLRRDKTPKRLHSPQRPNPQRMSNFNFSKNWPLLVIICGGGLLYEFLPTFLQNRELGEGRSAIAAGTVIEQRSFRKKTSSRDRSAPYYEVTYSFSVDAERYRGRHQCQCDELRGVKRGDDLEIIYALDKPQVNRPAIVQYNAAWILGGTAAGSVLLAAGLLLTGIRLGTQKRKASQSSPQ